MKRIFTLILISMSGLCLAQDPAFTQFYASPIYLNPAFAGSSRCPRLSLNYRNQWPGFDKTYITYS
ncbi:MAG: type IX secretion system membrane protein PorP/SprF, partial [Bacteroidota bacterium]